MEMNRLMRQSAPRATAGIIASGLSLALFVCFLYRLLFVRVEFSIGSQFSDSPSPMQLLEFGGVMMAGIAVGCSVWSWRKESTKDALTATLVTVHTLMVWGLLVMRGLR
jgi:hypothetical protein